MKKILAIMIAMTLMMTIMAACGDDKQTSSQEGIESAVTDTLTDDTLGEIFQEASEIGSGTAGVSLKRARIAAKIASYAAVIGYNEEAVDSLKKEMSARYDALDDQGKENLDDTFEFAIGLLDKVIVEGDYESVKGLFEDSGSSEDLDAVLKAPGLKQSYEAFKSAYQSIG